MINKALSNNFLIVFFTFLQLTVMAYSAGPPAGHNGQPPSGSSCGLVAQCHGADVINNVGIEITIDGNPNEYIPGEVYLIEVFINDPFSSCFGFQCGAQFENEIENAGEFSINSNNGDITVTDSFGFQYVEHNEPRRTGKWNFLWTAPNGNALDNVVFYAAGVVADCNGEPVNDPTYTTSKKIASGCRSIKIEPVMESYAIVPYCDYSRPMPSIAIDFEPVSGGSGAYTIITEGNSVTDKTALYEGDAFTYFYTLSDVENNTIGLTLVDDEGHVCKLDDDLITLFSSIPVNTWCPGEVDICNYEINVEYFDGEWNEIFNCNKEEDIISLVIDYVTINGSNYDRFYVFSLDGNELIWVPPSLPIYNGVEIYFTQAQIDALQVGFTIEDFNGCIKRFDLNDKIINTNISEICNLEIEEDPCEEVLSYNIEGGMEAPVFKCNPINPTNPIYTINVKNVTGGDGSYIITSKGGALTKSNIEEGESFTYVLTKTTITSNKAIVTIEDENGCSSTLDFNVSLASYDLDALCDCVINYDFEKIENTNTPVVNCVDKENGIFSLAITNVTGFTGSFDFLTSLGSVEVETNPIKFKINFTKADYDSGNLNFTIQSGSGDCSITNNLPDLSAIDFDSICGPPEPVCNLILELSSKTDLACNQPTGNINLITNAENNNGIFYTWQHNGTSLPINSNIGEGLEHGTYVIIAEDANGCKSASLTVVIEGYKEFRLLTNEPYTCSFDKQFYNQQFFYDGVEGEINVTTTNGIIENITSNSFSIKDVPNGSFADVVVTDNAGCSQSLRLGPYLCVDTSTENCEANAGAMLPVPFDVFCTLNAVVTLPIQFGYNTALDYGFLITDKDLNIIDFSDDSKIDISNNQAGTYCIHGVSYKKNTPNTPDFTASNINELYNQPGACFDINLEDCIEIELQAATNNPAPPTGPADTIFYCTGYTTPIDFCIPIEDSDGGKPYLVDIISFCNPSIQGDNCVHYPPLPGLVLGSDETLSLIFCDDDCPQQCDTSYVNVSIREDCTGYEEPSLNEFYCGFDTIRLSTKQSQPIDLCVECDQDIEEYFINDVESRAGGNFEQLLSGNCLKYLPKNEVYADVVEMELCLLDELVCVTKIFLIEVEKDDEPEECIEQQLCSLPTILIEICFDCEVSKHPDAEITDIDSKFNNCTTNEIRKMCFDYRPLPLMHLVGVDTVVTTYCNPNNQCFTTNTYLTFENCEGFATEILEPVLVENNTTVGANNDYFEINSTEETTINVLENDNGDVVNTGEVYVNIITAPQNGEINYNNTVNDISYTPNPNYVGSDSFVYEICSNGICDRAIASINIEDENNSIESVLSIAPNPVTDFLKINYTSKSTSKQKIFVELYNAAGQLVFDNRTLMPTNTYQENIDVTNFERGVYFFRIIEGKKISSEKIIVQ